MAYFRCGGGGVPSSLKTDMNTVLNKKFGTTSQDYPPNEWADDVNLLGKLPEKTASGSIAHFTDGADTVPLKTAVFNFTPTQAQGTPTPSNPLPITGHTGLNVVKCGANFMDAPTLYSDFEQSDGSFLGLGSDFNSTYFYIPSELVGVEVTFSAYIKIPTGSTITNPRVSARVNNVNTNGNAVTSNDYTLSSVTFTPTSTSDRVRITYGSNGSQQVQFKNVMLEVGNTATDYTEYVAPTTYPISWTDTVYGGYVNEKGEVWATHGVVTFDGNAEETWASYGSQNGFTKSIPTMKSGSAMQDGKSNFLANIATYTGFGIRFGGNNNSTIYLCHITDNISGVTDVASWKTYLQSNNLQVCYPLATPVKIATIDPIVINSALGVNNVWNDGGGETDVTYRADIDLLITELGG